MGVDSTSVVNRIHSSIDVPDRLGMALRSARTVLVPGPQSGFLSGSFSLVLTSCLSRVYHIDSNPSGANDSGPDSAKALTVRDIVNRLSNVHSVAQNKNEAFEVLSVN